MTRHVRGILFVDYVRMVRASKHIDWALHLVAEDLELVSEQVDLEGWYDMEAFERLGIAIVREVAFGQPMAVRMWGRFQFDSVLAVEPSLVAPDDPRDTMMRFQSLRRGFFDYDALEVTEVLDDAAIVSVCYGMSPEAEQAACHQTMGFCERLIETAGGRDVQARFTQESWRGPPRTLIEVQWKPAKPDQP